ncbi:DNA excision repair protein ERCC-8 [Strongylocentrotus purpuratus]|uniref:DNA excision repair protein ERCC-8 n=1 Tax=Strongylocentrotus purpuratus TaxID=7668 RepID=A0A7M7T3U9_STRPU|nr:DNA excision repair protein ERCC-8 [Strongylocentrotus purpuratus]
MLNVLAERSWGNVRPSQVHRAEATRRTFRLQLSKHRDVQRIHSSGINSLDIDPIDYKFMLSGGADGVIAIYDLECIPEVKEFTCETVCTIGRSNRHVHKHSVETVQWYPRDTGMFTSSSMDTTLKVWDTNALKPAERFVLGKGIYSHHMSPVANKHCLIAVGTIDPHATLCDLKSGSSTHILKGHKASVVCVQWSSKDEFLLATGSRDNKILMWDIRQAKGSLMSLDQHNGEVVKGSSAVSTAHSGHVNGLCFTENGLHLVSCGTDNRVRLWDTLNGKNTLINYGKVSNNMRKCIEICTSSGVQPDVAFIPSGSDIDMFDVFSGETDSTMKGHYNNVNCCVFHPLYQEVYSGGNDSNILIWEPDMGHIHFEEPPPKKLAGASKVKKFNGNEINATADTWSSSDEGD